MAVSEGELVRTTGIPRPPRPAEGRTNGTLPPRVAKAGPLRLVGSLFVWLIVAFNVAIFVFILMSSFKTTTEIFGAPWAFPVDLHLENWSRAWTSSGFGRATLNTLLLVVAGALSVVVISAPAAYILSRINSRPAGFVTVFFALGLGIPAQVTVIPLFVMMAEAGFANSLFGLYVLYTATHLPFTVFLFTGFFRSLPRDLEEAAGIDGASPSRTFWQIMLPLARSGIITVLTLNAIGMWNETFLALVFLQSDEKFPLSLALLNFLASMQYSGADYGALFAGVCVLLLPMLALYMWLWRRIIEGMTLGAGK